MSKFLKGLYFSPDKGGEGNGSGKEGEGEKPAEGQQKKPEGEVLEWDAFHKALPKEAQELISERDAGLKKALKTERDARGDLEKDLKEAAGKLEKDSDAQKEVLKLADEIAAGVEKSDFYEEAHEEGVSNLKLAYVVAKQDDLINKRGKVDWKTLKEDYPELFGKKKVPSGDAGAGTGGKLPGDKADMNVLIRKKAGR